MAATEVKIRGPFALVKAKKIVFEKSLTKQAFKDECDINKVMARYRSTGMLEHIRSNQGLYEDVTTVPDFHTAMMQVALVTEAFEGLSAEVRERFYNDPGRFYDFAVDVKNVDQLREWGMLRPEADAAPQGAPGAQGAPEAPRETLEPQEPPAGSPAPP